MRRVLADGTDPNSRPAHSYTPVLTPAVRAGFFEIVWTRGLEYAFFGSGDQSTTRMHLPKIPAALIHPFRPPRLLPI